MPVATERGRGMFACYIGGDTYIAKKQEAIVYNETTGYLFLENSNEDYDFRLFVYEGMFYEGVYQFDSTGEEIMQDFVPYTLSPGGMNNLTVTKLDPINKIVAGSFAMDLVNEIGTPLKVTDGRFDLEINIIE